jgi:hypothetical protein
MSNFIYASAPALNAIVRTDMQTDAMKLFATDLRSPQGIAFAPDGTLFVVEGDAGQLSVIDGNGKVRKHAGGLTAPTGLVIDAVGDCYIAESVGDSIKRVRADGTVSTLATGLGNPHYLAYDGRHFLYCGGGPNYHVHQVNGAGYKTLFHELTAPASGIACDNDECVYVSGERATADSTPYIARFTPDGAGAVFIWGAPRGTITVYGATANNHRIYSIGPNTIGTFQTASSAYVRRSAWVEYAATPPDFRFPQ